MNLSTVTDGPGGGTFAGRLDGIAVTGSAFSPLTASFRFPGDGGNGFGSTVNGTSPQFSYADVYAPSAPAVDRVGFSTSGDTSSVVTVTFNAPVTDLRFHVANLSGASYAFDLNNGLTGVSLVRGNGGGGDGLRVVGSTVSDANPATNNSFFGQSPQFPPPLTGPRAAFGTVSLNGTFTVLNFTMRAANGDNGSAFTISSVPEPAAMTLIGFSSCMLLRRRRPVT